MSNQTEPLLPDSPTPGDGKNIDPATEAVLAYDENMARTDALIVAADTWLSEVGEIDSDALADRGEGFVTQLQGHDKVLEAGRVAERKPHLDANKEIQGRYVVPQGRLGKAVERMKGLLTPWAKIKKDRAQATEREAREEAERLRKEAVDAERKQQEEAEAARKAGEEAAKPTIDETLQQEALEKEANAQEARASRMARQSDGIRGAGSTKKRSLRTVWTATLTDLNAALLYYSDNPAIQIVLQSCADGDVRRGERKIPGFEITSEEKL